MARAHLRYAEMTEGPLVLAARRRDEGAFGELVRRRQGWLLALLHRLTGDRALSEDLAQEALMRAWDRLPRLESPAAFGSWLRRIAVTVFLDHVRKKGIRLETLADDPPFVDDAPAVAAAGAARLDLERALATLSAAERLCITLSYGEGQSHGEIADSTRLPVGTVKSHIARGSAKMREVLRDAPG